MTKAKRARDLGLPFLGMTGAYNAITDVPGVKVGFTTLIEGEGLLKVGEGPVRTGVTAILPRGIKDNMQPIWAGHYNLNGNGEMTGTHWINDAGYFTSPICLTNTHSVGIAHHALTKWMIENYREQFHKEHLWAMPVVAETYDGVLNDINGQHITEKHVLNAIQTAKPGPVPEGNVGGGTGMICYEFKGGTGTSSRVINIDDEAYHIGSLVQANHGIREWLTILGAPVGKHLTKSQVQSEEQGSIIVIIGTDIPMLPNQLKRVAKRAAIGIGRTGTPGGNNSGDIFLAFSVANEKEIPQVSGKKLNMDFINDEAFDAIYEAVCQTVEESVINAMVASETMSMIKPHGKRVHAIDHEELLEVMKKYSKI